MGSFVGCRQPNGSYGKPFRIHMNLQKQKAKNKISSLPTLKQIQNYIYHQRKARGDSNKLEDIEKYVKSRSYETRASETDMFFFGADLGEGSDAKNY